MRWPGKWKKHCKQIGSQSSGRIKQLPGEMDDPSISPDWFGKKAK
jgi:hypothetical protein